MFSSAQPTKLILVDGLSGSGKSVQAQWLEVELRRRAVPVRWFWEAEIDHPLYWFSGWWRPEFDLADHLQDIPAALAQSLARWEPFVQAALAAPTVTILDGFPLLNTIGLLLCGDPPDELLLAYARRLQALIAPLVPALIYLYQPDVRVALRRILAIRGMDFERVLFRNFSHFPFCARRGLADFECLAQTWTRNQALVGQLLPGYAARQIVIDITRQSWAASRQQISAFLELPPDTAASAVDAAPCAGAYRGTRAVDVRCQDDGTLVAEENGLTTPLIHVEGMTFYRQALPVTYTFAAEGRTRRLIIDARRMAEGVETLTRADG